MKILIIQITRLGDILCTMPALAALRRENPQAELHFLVRKRFAQAVEGHRVIDHLWRLDSQKLLGPLIADGNRIVDAAQVLKDLVNELRAEKFDRIINLSFSPASSFLTHLISRGSTPVTGYTRTADLYLHIPDRPSQFFKSQVGLDKSNRVHISDILAWVAGVELQPADTRHGPEVRDAERAGVVCHLGASQAQKSWPVAYWVSFLQKLSTDSALEITLIGGPEDEGMARNICLQIGERTNIRNLVGKTSFNELYAVVGGAKLYVGADSGPLHIANFTECRTLNLSVGDVRFWETGPTTKGSRVLVSRNPEFLNSDTVYENARQMLSGAATTSGCAECVRGRGVRYTVHPGCNITPDNWKFVDWMHFEGEIPSLSGEILQAVRQVHEICVIAEQQLEALQQSPEKTEIIGILDRLDQLLEIMRENIAPMTPLLDGFKTEKENILPGSRDEIFFATKRCYRRLARFAALLEPRKGDHVEQNPLA